MKGLKNKHKDIVGQSLRKNHLPQWDEQHFLEFFALIHHFAPKGEWLWNDLAIKTFCQQAENRPLWEEWMWRFEMKKEEPNLPSIRSRITGFVPLIGSYLQGNPHVITKRMREIMKANSILEKYTEPFKMVENEIGGMSIMPNTDQGQVFELPEIQYNKAILKMSAIANDLIEGITKDELKKMPFNERVELALKIMNFMSRANGGQKPNVAIFKQLIINQAGRDELEAAMVAYNQE